MPAPRRPATRSSRWRRTWCRDGRRRRSPPRWPGVLPDLRPQHPVLLGFGDGRAQSRTEPVGHHHVEQGVEGRQPAGPCHLPHAPALGVGVLGAKVSSMIRRSHTARWRRIPASSDCARRPGGGGSSGSESAAMRSATGSAKTSRHPGRPSRMAPCSKSQPHLHGVGQRQRHSFPPRQPHPRR